MSDYHYVADGGYSSAFVQQDRSRWIDTTAQLKIHQDFLGSLAETGARLKTEVELLRSQMDSILASDDLFKDYASLTKTIAERVTVLEQVQNTIAFAKLQDTVKTDGFNPPEPEICSVCFNQETPSPLARRLERTACDPTGAWVIGWVSTLATLLVIVLTFVLTGCLPTHNHNYHPAVLIPTTSEVTSNVK
jgi:hypothetical protein